MRTMARAIPLGKGWSKQTYIAMVNNTEYGTGMLSTFIVGRVMFAAGKCFTSKQHGIIIHQACLRAQEKKFKPTTIIVCLLSGKELDTHIVNSKVEHYKINNDLDPKLAATFQASKTMIATTMDNGCYLLPNTLL